LLGSITRPAAKHCTESFVYPREKQCKNANEALVDLLGSIAQRKKATPAQIALAWLLAQKPWIVPIPGTTKMRRLEENIGAVSIELTPENLGEIDAAASKIEDQGGRRSVSGTPGENDRFVSDKT
jgi:aryl-alcohol dehydrogenase-like predicted oxidoreductase